MGRKVPRCHPNYSSSIVLVGSNLSKYYKGYYPFGSSPTVRPVSKYSIPNRKADGLLIFSGFHQTPALCASFRNLIFPITFTLFNNGLLYNIIYIFSILFFKCKIIPFMDCVLTHIYYTISKLSIFLAISTAFFSSSPRAINASPLITSLI